MINNANVYRLSGRTTCHVYAEDDVCEHAQPITLTRREYRTRFTTAVANPTSVSGLSSAGYKANNKSFIYFNFESILWSVF